MRTAFFLALALLGIAPQATQPQSFPAKPITLIAPFAAGGTSDVVSRTVATRISDTLRQPVVVVNRTGADGTIGIGAAATA